jgi:transketolase
MKMLPGMTVINPCDFNQTKAATIAIANYEGPVYLRFGRPKWPNFTSVYGSDFVIGKAQVLAEGSDVSLFACGHMVWLSIEAAKMLAAEGICAEVINVHTVKPLDTEVVLASLAKTGCAVTAEEHSLIGGLGDSIAQAAARFHPIPIEYIGTQDTFGESGKPIELLRKYGLDAENIAAAAKKVLARKN